MPHFQHRRGLPSRTRQHDHTRWESDLHPEFTWKHAAALGLLIAALLLAGILSTELPV
jgi:hypothetical protein